MRAATTLRIRPRRPGPPTPRPTTEPASLIRTACIIDRKDRPTKARIQDTRKAQLQANPASLIRANVHHRPEGQTKPRPPTSPPICSALREHQRL